MKYIYVDIDNTICQTIGSDYENAIPIPGNIEKINKLYDNNIITYWTARGQSSGINWFSKTNEQLKKWGCKFHGLRTDKPGFDLLIDDRTKRIDEL
jgi:hypothetical protein